MADTVDMARDIEAETIMLGIASATRPLAPGTAGECEQCEWWMPRLVGGLCAFCRDGRPRPADWEPPVPPQLDENTQPTPAEKEAAMPAKSIQIPASADEVIAAIEAHAQEAGVSLGLATAILIKRGMSTGADESGAAAAAVVPATIDDLCDQLRALFASRDLSAAAALTAERDAAVARALIAEDKISQMKALFA